MNIEPENVEENEDANLISDLEAEDENGDDENDDEDQPMLCTLSEDTRWILRLTLLFEAITSFLRFGLHKESTRDTAKFAKYTFGLRIHHGYLGIVLLLITGFLSSYRRPWCRRIGWALIFSDLIHHFLVLWPITGSPHFDFVYPKQ